MENRKSGWIRGSSPSKPRLDGTLLTFGKVKDGETKDIFVRFVGEPELIYVIYDTNANRYYEVDPGHPQAKERYWVKAIVYSNDKFIGKVAMMTPYLMDTLAKFNETPQGEGFSDPVNGKFVIITVSKSKSTQKINYTVRAAVIKKPLSIDLDSIIFPDIHKVILQRKAVNPINTGEINNAKTNIFESEDPGPFKAPSDGVEITGVEDEVEDDVPF